jgi:hypothetical protein
MNWYFFGAMIWISLGLWAIFNTVTDIEDRVKNIQVMLMELKNREGPQH